ncbi:FHF complex subunit HOOK-interacting protein 1B-like [Ciona intestinalis]
MSWLKKKLTGRDNHRVQTQPDVTQVCLEAFKSHWLQINGVIEATTPHDAFDGSNNSFIDNITIDDVDIVRNLLEQMIYLLVEEQSSGQLMGPLLEYAITKNVFEKLYTWWNYSSSFKQDIMLNLMKVYEVLISQAQHSLLHHKQLVGPMLKLLSSNHQPRSEELDHHIVLLLNLLCVWVNRDPSLLLVFFNASESQGPANFFLFSNLIEYVHREGTVGQQARDALLLCMALSSENESVAEYIVNGSNFCPVLATGLSGLYSTLPRHMEVRADDWHCLQRSDWTIVTELTNFMNSFEFCNSVIEVAHPQVSEQLLDFIYNGFLVSVFGPSLHKTSAGEVVVTTAYLNLFLRSVTAPALMRCFLKFLLTHRHESSLIINTLIQRIASNNRLALVSLSLIRTLVDLNCEDLMLQLVFSHLLPCQHILGSQRRAIRDVDLYNASASRFLALTPDACAMETSENGNEDEILRPVNQTNDHQEATSSTTPHHNINETPSKDGNNGDMASHNTPNIQDTSYNPNSPEHKELSTRSQTITSPSTMAEFGPDLKSQLALNTSYMDYLEDARYAIQQCQDACCGWSVKYDGTEDNEGVSNLLQRGDSLKQETSVIQEHTNGETTDLKTGSESAMKALSAAYQAINITARALTDDLSSCDAHDTTADDTAHDATHRDTANHDTANYDATHEVHDVVHGENKKVDLDENFNQQEKKDLESKSTTTTSSLSGKPRGHSNPQSTVDEFFRSLMEIVPKTTREKVEKKTFNKLSIDDDIESGIEVSSDGDIPQYGNDDHDHKHTSDHSEDTISESSNRSNNMDNQPTKEQLLVENDIKEFEETTKLQHYSFMDDTDDEFDDSASMTSSFYEVCEDYTPTEVSVPSNIPLKLQGIPYTGPLMGTLFAKLDQMISNSLYENLLLTGIITRLAIYPQPLLRSFLLNTQMVFHPSVRSLYQVLNSARNKINNYAKEVSDFTILVRRAQKYLLARGTLPLSGDARSRNIVREKPMPVPKVKTKTLGDMFVRRKERKRKPLLPKLESLLERRDRSASSASTTDAKPHPSDGAAESGSLFYVKQRVQEREREQRKMRELKTKNAVYACIVLAEFLKELAAVAQEHAVSNIL